MLFWNGADVKGQGGLDIPIDGQIDLVLAVLLKLEVLDVQDQIDHCRGYIIASHTWLASTNAPSTFSLPRWSVAASHSKKDSIFMAFSSRLKAMAIIAD